MIATLVGPSTRPSDTRPSAAPPVPGHGSPKAFGTALDPIGV